MFSTHTSPIETNVLIFLTVRNGRKNVFQNLRDGTTNAGFIDTLSIFYISVCVRACVGARRDSWDSPVGILNKLRASWSGIGV
jgi:hypothetical protein